MGKWCSQPSSWQNIYWYWTLTIKCRCCWQRRNGSRGFDYRCLHLNPSGTGRLASNFLKVVEKIWENRGYLGTLQQKVFDPEYLSKPAFAKLDGDSSPSASTFRLPLKVKNRNSPKIGQIIINSLLGANLTL